MRLRISRTSIAALLLLSAAALSAPAPVEPAPTSADGNDVENIVVSGRRGEGIGLQRFMLDFVAEIGDPVSDNRGYARWLNRVCIGVTNLPNAQFAQYILDRMSTTALELGLRPGEPGCAPNIQIIFATDAAALTAALVESQPRVFRPHAGTGGTTQGLQALERFTNSEAAVRWWQTTMAVDRSGGIALKLPHAIENGISANGDASSATAVILPDALASAPWISGTGSRLTNSVSDVLAAAYVVVDLGKLGATTVAQLSDYLAMVSLAQIDPDAVPANYDSILNLFNSADSAAGMTELDRIYLSALYSMDKSRMPNMQRSLLANTMMRKQLAGGE